MVVVQRPNKIMGKPILGTDVPEDNEVVTYDDATGFWNAEAGGGSGTPFSVVHKSADETISNDSVLTLDDDLQFSAEANSKYVIIMNCMTGATAVADFKYTMIGPTGYTFEMAHTFAKTATGFSEGDISIIQSSTPTNLRTATYIGMLTTAGTAGTVGLQWSQNNAEVSDCIMYAESFIMYRKVD